MTNTKMTYLTALNTVLNDSAITLSADVREKLTALRDKYAQPKGKGERKPTKNQVANAELTTVILDGMEANRLYTIKEIQAEIPQTADLSNQKISRLLGDSVDAGKIVRIKEKGKTFFQRKG